MVNFELFNKKGAIGLILTWIVAFLIIFFIMLVFVSVSALLAGKKALPIIGSGFSSAEIIKTNNYLESQRMLDYFLNAPLDDGKTISKLIIEKMISGGDYNRKKIQESIEKILKENQYEKICYLDFIIDKQRIYNKEIMGKYKDEGLAKTMMFLNDKKINIELYYRKC